MSSLPVSFPFSEGVLADRLRFTYILAAGMVLLILVEMLFATDFQVQRLAQFGLLFIIVASSIGLLIILLNRYMFRRWRQMSLYLEPDGLMREAGTVRQKILWHSISKLRFRYNPWGDLRIIEVFTPSGSPLTLFGYDPMSEVAEIIKDRVQPGTPVEIKRHRVDWENPVIMVASIFAAALIFEAIRRLSGQVVFANISALVQISFGVFFIAYGPLSRANPNLRRWELALGALIIVATSISLAIKLRALVG
jgi:hypothetical protein